MLQRKNFYLILLFSKINLKNYEKILGSGVSVEGLPTFLAMPVARLINLILYKRLEFNCCDRSQIIFTNLKQVRKIKKSYNRIETTCFLLVAKFQSVYDFYSNSKRSLELPFKYDVRTRSPFPNPRRNATASLFSLHLFSSSCVSYCFSNTM